MERTLEELGLTKTESKVYLCLLRKGSIPIGSITKDTGIHRRTIYDIIERLIEKGLVNYILNNDIKYFEAIDPERLLDILKEKEEKIKSILGELKILHKGIKEKKETIFLKGKHSIQTIFNDQLKIGQEILFMGKGVDEIIKFHATKFNEKRIEKNIKIKMLFDRSSKEFEDIKKIKLAEIKFMEADYSSPIITCIYGNNVSIMLHNNLSPIAILIRQKDIADGFREQFNLLWHISKI